MRVRWLLLGLAACGHVGFSGGDGGTPGDTVSSGIVAVATAVGTNAATDTTVSSQPQTFAAGDLLVALIHVDNSADDVSGVTDTAGNAFTLAPSSHLVLTGDGIQVVEIWYAHDLAGASADVVTAALTGAASATLVVREYRGADPSAPLETAATGSVLDTTLVASAPFTPAAAGNLNVAFGVPQDTGTIVAGTGMWTAGASYTLVVHEPMRDLAVEEQLAAAAGAQTASLEYSAPGNMIISVASFRPAAP